MWIRIKQDPPTLRNPPSSQRFRRMMEMIRGQMIKVDTTYLFHNQFNTEPIPGVSPKMRVYEKDVEDVIGDIRPYYQKCEWCGHSTPKEATICPYCNSDSYLIPLSAREFPEEQAMFIQPRR